MKTLYDIVLAPHLLRARKKGLSEQSVADHINSMTNVELLQAMSDALPGAIDELRRQRINQRHAREEAVHAASLAAVYGHHGQG